MDKAASLRLTPAGEQVLLHRTHKLSIKQRSLLILLTAPQSVGQLLERTILPAAEFFGEMRSLIEGGFVAPDVHPAPSAKTGQVKVPPVGQGNPGHETPTPAFKEGLVLSEAKFLLVDFCIDVFGTDAPALIDRIQSCDNIQEFSTCYAKVWSLVKKHRPGQSSKMELLIQAINDAV